MKYIRKINNYFVGKKLKEYDIKDYYIHIDGTIDVLSNVYLQDRGLEKIPFKFGSVSGHFYCFNNKLTSLEGCPYYVGGTFDCHVNKLGNLKGGPVEVGGNYICTSTYLNTLEGAPTEVGGKFDCRFNQLKDLDISTYIKGHLYCGYNDIDENDYNFYGETDKGIIFKQY